MFSIATKVLLTLNVFQALIVYIMLLTYWLPYSVYLSSVQKAPAMSWLSRLLNLGPSSALSFLIVGMVGRQFGFRVGLHVVQTVMCYQWGALSSQGLSQDGDVVIGGLFGLGREPSLISPNFTTLPHYNPCTG